MTMGAVDSQAFLRGLYLELSAEYDEATAQAVDIGGAGTEPATTISTPAPRWPSASTTCACWRASGSGATRSSMPCAGSMTGPTAAASSAAS